jgi:membrane-associated protease RseP (regulator of RpoE activity)
MSVLWWVLLFIGALWAGILLIDRYYNLKKRGFEVAPGLIMWRTKRGLKFIDRIAKSHRRGWLTFGTMAAVVGTALMVFIFSMMVLNIIFILSQPTEAPAGVRLALPGIVPGLSVLAWLIAIGTLVVVHEFAHGFVLRAQNLETKSVGGLLLLAIPGAFVEPDEKQLKKAPILKRLRVFGAGSFANVLFALLCFGILLLLVVPKPGIHIKDTIENYPAENMLEPGTHILAIDNTPMETYNVFSDFMDNTKPGQIIELSTNKGDFSVELAEDPDNENSGYLGVKVLSITATPRSKFINPIFFLAAAMSEIWGRPVFHSYVYDSLVPWAVIDIIKWMFVLNLLIGLFNLLPAVPLDGGYILQGIVERRASKKTAKRVAYAFSIVVLALIIMNFMPLVL